MRRKRRFSWYATIGSAGLTPDDQLSGRSFAVDVFNSSPVIINTLILPVTPDAPVDPTNVGNFDGGNVLIQERDYFIERLVGKLFIGLRLITNSPPAVLVGAGFFVARANDSDGSGGGVDTPIGSATLAERNSNYSPLHLDCIREPWMWRRTWVLGGAPTAANGLSDNPTANAFYGSALDGPHFDVKSVRRVAQDQRLWFAISTAALQNVTEGVDGGITGYLDLRLLGQQRKARNKSAF